jgi:hypothetical protein
MKGVQNQRMNEVRIWPMMVFAGTFDDPLDLCEMICTWHRCADKIIEVESDSSSYLYFQRAEASKQSRKRSPD